MTTVRTTVSDSSNWLCRQRLRKKPFFGRNRAESVLLTRQARLRSAMFRVNVGEYEICCQADGLPAMLSEYQQRAALAEEFGASGEDGASVCFVSIGRPPEWPFLVVIQRYAPAGCGFSPGVLLVPEAPRVFVGAGRRLLAYDLSRPARLWEDEAECGFWSWSRHGQVVLMAAELELAAWDINGRKLWSRFVEPPWEYAVAGEFVTVNVMGAVSRICLQSGERPNACAPA
jgi:hypothetical protein